MKLIQIRIIVFYSSISQVTIGQILTNYFVTSWASWPSDSIAHIPVSPNYNYNYDID
ncbi:MAG: hypothetical protein JKY48_16350 [Flavobacteriales bacterium]|nr:hypothetical protein [Flavobacteriales bacterium]